MRITGGARFSMEIIELVIDTPSDFYRFLAESYRLESVGVLPEHLVPGIPDIHGCAIPHFHFEQISSFYQVTDFPIAIVY